MLPLIPLLQLQGVRTFAEPCCGDGALVRHLESFGLRCVYQGDIATGQDALATTDYGNPDKNITNTPWLRRWLHPLIRHLQTIAPTWLLIDADWAHTKQAVPYLPQCTDILPIGRVIWIPGTKNGGFDNAAWHHFDARHTAGPHLHPFRSATLRSPPSRLCGKCGRPYRPLALGLKFCGDACKQRAYRERLAVTQT